MCSKSAPKSSHGEEISFIKKKFFTAAVSSLNFKCNIGCRPKFATGLNIRIIIVQQVTKLYFCQSDSTPWTLTLILVVKNFKK